MDKHSSLTGSKFSTLGWHLYCFCLSGCLFHKCTDFPFARLNLFVLFSLSEVPSIERVAREKVLEVFDAVRGEYLCLLARHVSGCYTCKQMKRLLI